MAVFKNGIFASYNGEIVNPVSNIAASVVANNFFQSTGITNQQQRYAVYNLVADLQSYNIWDKMKAIYPMVGQADVSSSFEVNLKDPSTFRGTFFGGWTFASTGIQGNGTNAYMDTGFNSSIEVALNSHAYGIYLPNNYSSGTVFQELGAYGPGDYGTILYGNFGGSSYNRIHSNEWNGIYQAGNGFILATRTDANVTRNFLNGVFKIVSSEASTLASPYNYYIGARGNNGSGVFFSPKLISFAMMSDGLTDTEASNLYTAVQRFQTTLGRQV
jgi:hypothetical protein